MRILVNEQPTECPEGSSVADLLAQLDIPTVGTAVARNDAVVRKALHAETTLTDGDRIEIIRAVAGG